MNNPRTTQRAGDRDTLDDALDILRQAAYDAGRWAGRGDHDYPYEFRQAAERNHQALDTVSRTIEQQQARIEELERKLETANDAVDMYAAGAVQHASLDPFASALRRQGESLESYEQRIKSWRPSTKEQR